MIKIVSDTRLKKEINRAIARRAHSGKPLPANKNRSEQIAETLHGISVLTDTIKMLRDYGFRDSEQYRELWQIRKEFRKTLSLY